METLQFPHSLAVSPGSASASGKQFRRSIGAKARTLRFSTLCHTTNQGTAVARSQIQHAQLAARHPAGLSHWPLRTGGHRPATRRAAGRSDQQLPSGQRRFQEPADGDEELYRVLDLATPEELREVSDILYGQSLLSPLVKSLAVGDGSRNEPITEALHEGTVEGREEARESLLRRLEARFLFLGADSRATLRGRRPTYRGVLLAVKERLQVPCSSRLATEDLEAEIFLHLLQSTSSQGKVPPREKTGPGPKMSAINNPDIAQVKGLRGTLVTALKMGGEELLSTFFKGGSALTMSTLQSLVVKKLTGKVLLERARYQVAKEVLIKGGQVVATKLEAQLALLTARQGLAGAAARYVSLRSMMMLVGPLLWGTFLADVVIQSVGTDYARVVRAVFAFAQIRLTRTYGWTPADAGP